jgi:hypothetical protein
VAGRTDKASTDSNQAQTCTSRWSHSDEPRTSPVQVATLATSDNASSSMMVLL